VSHTTVASPALSGVPRTLMLTTRARVDEHHRPNGILRDPIVADEAVDELVYTALTRTQRILIIVAGPGVGDDLLEILKCLRRDRINPWTRSASDVIDSWYMQELCEIANGAVKLTPAQTPPAPPAGPGSDPG